MGAAVILLLLFLLLPGCTVTEQVPYEYISDGVYAVGDITYERGIKRNRLPTDIQALQYVCDDNGIDLVKGELAYYHGSLYSLSNYRQLLLDSGYTVESETRTYSVLDTVLAKDGDRVRLIYQQSGAIRILFENQGGAAHIILEGI